MKITGMMAIATFTVTIVAGSGVVLAGTTSVSRCNYTEGATYKPGLWITTDGVTRLVKVNEEGLTRRIIYDDALAADFVRAQSGGQDIGSVVSFTNACSSSAIYSYAGEEDTIVVAEVIDPPDCGPPDCGPPDCGPPDCGPPDCGPPDCGPPDCGPLD